MRDSGAFNAARRRRLSSVITKLVFMGIFVEERALPDLFLVDSRVKFRQCAYWSRKVDIVIELFMDSVLVAGSRSLATRV